MSQSIQSDSRPLIQLNRPSAKKIEFPWIRIAAALTILLIAAWFVRSYINLSQPSDYHEWETQIFAETEVVEKELKDGSEVDLNIGTKIYVADNFGKKERRIQLEGEAYFKVQADKDKAFIIEAEELQITVLGTSFNVFAYPDSSVIRVEVTEGIVSVFLMNEEYILTEGMLLEFDRTNQQIIEGKSDGDEHFWNNRILDFRRSPMNEVIETLERNYETSILLLNPEIANCELTVEFENEELENILEILSATLDLTISEEENQWLIDGKGCAAGI